jgi:glycosyltransferase involved in cell wall biosynthesis
MYVKKISIITLTYKNWHLLDKAIASVASQLINENYEVEYLIVDDGTQDFDSQYVLSLLADTGLNYRIILNEENMGTVASFNNAIQQSTGDIIIPLSADDEFYDASVVNDIADEFMRTKAYVITGLRVPVESGQEKPSLPRKQDLKLFNNRKALLNKLLMHGNIISGASTYYHRSVFNTIGLFDTNYLLLEDHPFYIKLLRKEIPIVVFCKKVIKYGTTGVTSSVGVNPLVIRDNLRLYNSCINDFNLNFFEKRYVKYTKILNKKQRIILAWKYPEQFVFLCLLKLSVIFKGIFK